MPGTKEGGIKAAATNKLRYGNDFYIKLGHIGGQARRTPTGFAYEKAGKDGLTGPERAVLAGRKGGNLSKRTKHEQPEQRQESLPNETKEVRRGLLDRFIHKGW